MSQRQEGGDNSINVQGEQVVISQGLSVAEVREICSDIFESNFLRLRQEAADTARSRANEITERLLARLESANPDALNRANDPGFQYDVFKVQKEFARNGDEDTGELLVDLLVERTKCEPKALTEIVLSESLEVVPRLTKDQLAALSIIFYLGYTRHLRFPTVPLTDYLGERIAPFVADLPQRDSAFQHIEFAGCGQVGLGTRSIPKKFRDVYPGLFQRGFAPGDLVSALQLEDLPEWVPLEQNPDAPNLSQFAVVFRDDDLENAAKKASADEGLEKALLAFFDRQIKSEEEIREALVEAHECMAPLLDKWDNTAIKRMTLTSVGIAIAIANIRRVTGHEERLDIWI